MNPDPATPASPWLLACLCAGWCRTCDGYRLVMEQAQAAHPGWHLAWVDIEDHADIADEFDVETFPTLLVADAAGTRFLGPLLPHAETLSRMLTALPAPQPSSLHAELLVAVLEKKPALFTVPRAA